MIRVCRMRIRCAACRRSTELCVALWRMREIGEIETGGARAGIRWCLSRLERFLRREFSRAPLALSFDYAAIAMTDLISISERRIDPAG
jgi:hypothetical protein